MTGIIFMVALGSSKLAPEAAQKQPAAARELWESPGSPGEAQEEPRRAQEHPQV